MKNTKIKIQYQPNTLLIHGKDHDLYIKQNRYGGNTLHATGAKQNQRRYMGIKRQEQIKAILN